MTEYIVANEKCLMANGVSSNGKAYSSTIYPDGGLTAAETAEKIRELTRDNGWPITIDEDTVEQLYEQNNEIHFIEMMIAKEEQPVILNDDELSLPYVPHEIYAYLIGCGSILQANNILSQLAEKYNNEVEIRFALDLEDSSSEKHIKMSLLVA